MGGACSICFTLNEDDKDGSAGDKSGDKSGGGGKKKQQSDEHPETQLFQMQPRMHPRNSVAVSTAARSGSLASAGMSGAYSSSPPRPPHPFATSTTTFRKDSAATPTAASSVTASDLSGSSASASAGSRQSIIVSPTDRPKGTTTTTTSSSTDRQMTEKRLTTTTTTTTTASDNTVKILLLGAGESGKSTIVKQMKIIHGNWFSRDELLQYRAIIFANIIEGAQQVIRVCETLGYLEKLRPEPVEYIRSLDGAGDVTDDDDEEDNTQTHQQRLQLQALPFELVQAINYLWLESGIRNSFSNICHASYVLDSAAYFFEEINRIGGMDYLPNTMDVLKARLKSTGVTEYRFRSGPLNINMYDMGGQRPERRSWIKSFDAVVTVIFCVALSEYDQFLLEQPNQNRLLESFQLFSDIVRSRYFINSSVVLFLNKIDIFQEKIKQIPLSNYFPEYEGGDDLGAASEFVKAKFISLNHNKIPLYTYLTQATDTRNIELVFAAVRETVLTQALKQSGLF